jgi:hypothetical protein
MLTHSQVRARLGQGVALAEELATTIVAESAATIALPFITAWVRVLRADV